MLYAHELELHNVLLDDWFPNPVKSLFVTDN